MTKTRPHTKAQRPTRVGCGVDGRSTMFESTKANHNIEVRNRSRWPFSPVPATAIADGDRKTTPQEGAAANTRCLGSRGVCRPCLKAKKALLQHRSPSQDPAPNGAGIVFGARPNFTQKLSYMSRISASKPPTPFSPVLLGAFYNPSRPGKSAQVLPSVRTVRI